MKNGNEIRDPGELSTRELEAILDAAWEQEAPEDLRQLQAAVSELEKRQAARVDTAAAWQTFQRCYHTPEGKARSLYPCGSSAGETTGCRRGKRSLWRGLCAAAAAACLLLVLTVPAFGSKSLLRRFGQWTDTVFFFGTEAPEPSEENRGSIEDPRLQRIADAVAQYAPDAQVVPRTLPRDFAESTVRTHTYADTVRIVGSFGADLTLEYTVHGGAGVELTVQEDWERLEVNGNMHYLFFEDDRAVCVWTRGNVECRVSGDISRGELVALLCAIYG